MSVNDPNTQAAPTPIGDGVSQMMGSDAFNKSTVVKNESLELFNSFTPEEYKGKPWVQEISKSADPRGELFKQYEHAQSLVGQTKLQIPGDNATPEQIKEWHKAIGVPETVEAYKIEPTQWGDEDKPYAELVAKSRVTGIEDALKKAALEAGITPKQYEKLSKTHDSTMVQWLKENKIETDKVAADNNVAFDQMVQKKYGDKKDTVLNTGKKLIESSVAPETVAALQKLPPEAIAIMAEAMYSVGVKHIREDNFNIGSGGSGNMNAPTTEEEITAAANKLKTKAYWDNRHPDHKATVKQVNDVYERGRNIIEKSRK